MEHPLDKKMKAIKNKMDLLLIEKIKLQGEMRNSKSYNNHSCFGTYKLPKGKQIKPLT